GIQAMRRYGDRLGLAFQVVDDILDYIGDEAHLGKPVGGDLRQGTITLPVICLRELMPDAEYRAAFASDDIAALIEMVRVSPAIERAQAEADTLLTEAREALQHVPAGPARDALESLTHYVVERRV
ncbi:MAG: polyprenyl synthetase family protein, partial [Chloroflexota bacterium]